MKKSRPPQVPFHASSNSEFFQCSDCTKVFLERKRYNQHLKTHKKPLKCENCPRGFALRSDLTRHVKTRHRVVQLRHACPFDGCSFNTTRKDNLHQHMKRQHGSMVPSSSNHEGSGYGMADAQPKIDATNSDCDVNFEEANRERSPDTALPSIFSAAVADNVSFLKQLLSSGADMYTVTDDGCNALHAAARAGKIQATKFLLSLGVPSILNMKKRLPVHEAVLSGSWDTLRILIEHRETLPEISKSNYPTACSSTLLNLLLQSENRDMIKNWIEYNGSNVIKEKNLPISHHIAQLKDASILEMLISYNIIDMHEPDSMGYTPIHHAAKNKNPEIMHQILSHPDTCVTMLSRTYRNRKLSALGMTIRNDNLEVFNTLLEDGRVCWDTYWNAPIEELRTCRIHKRWGMWKLLIKHHWTSETNNEPSLLSASVKGEEQRVVELLAQGSVAYEREYPSPFNAAIAVGHLNIAKLLVERNKHMVSWEKIFVNFEVVEIAISNNDERMVSFLLDNCETLCLDKDRVTGQVTHCGSLNMVKKLLSWPGLSLSAIITSLHFNFRPDPQILRLLLSDPRVIAEIKKSLISIRPIHDAVKSGGTEVVEILLNDGLWPDLDINATERDWNYEIRTALDVAVRRNRTDLISLLRSYRAKTYQELRIQEEADVIPAQYEEADREFQRQTTVFFSNHNDSGHHLMPQTIRAGDDLDEGSDMEIENGYPDA